MDNEVRTLIVRRRPVREIPKGVVRRDTDSRLDPAKEITILSHPLFTLPRESREPK